MSRFDPHAQPRYERTMFDDIPETPALARATDPQTSHEAAAEMTASGAAHAQRAAVLAAVRAHPGRTSDELADAIGADRHMPARRLIELERAGLVERGPPRASKLTGRSGLTYFPATVARPTKGPT